MPQNYDDFMLCFRRYSIERVYRERKLFGSHPRELTECAFDIVTNSPGSLQPDAEVLHLVTEIINEFPELQVCRLSFPILQILYIVISEFITNLK